MQELKETPSVTQIARAFLLSGQGRNTAPDITFESRFPEDAVRLVLTHAEQEGVKEFAGLLFGSMQGALLSEIEDPNPSPVHMDTRTAAYHLTAARTLKDALAAIRDCREITADDRLAASDLLGVLK